MKIKAFLIPLLLLNFGARLFGQAPIITYPATLKFNVGTAITQVSPISTGGAVPATIYGQVSTFAGSGHADLFNGTGINSSFNNPESGTFDAAGNLYIAELTNNCVRKITPAGVVTTLSGSPGRVGFLDGPAANAFFKGVTGVVADANGNLYITDLNNYRIRKITSDGTTVSTIAGNGTKASTDGAASAATFTAPTAITIDGAGNLFVIDGNIIRKITVAGVVTTLAGSATAGAVNGTGKAASFNGPTGIATDAAGNIYVADKGNSLIRKITPAGVVSTFAGTGKNGWTDGAALAAQFSGPSGIGVDKIGNIYVADSYNSVIRRIAAGGTVSTIAGNGYSGIIDGSAGSSKFYHPIGVTPDNNGNIFIADQSNQRIRKVILTGYSIRPALPAGLTFNIATGVITGSPLVVTPVTAYSITAYNKSGSSTKLINISTVVPAVAPSITTFWPKSLIAGQTSSITGANLAGVSGVTIGGVKAASFRILSPTNIVAIIAPGTVSGNIVVTNPYGSATVSGFKILIAPHISYTTKQTYKTGVAITPLIPVNTGGDVPPAAYHQVSTYAGSSTSSGFVNGTSSQARFYGPRAVALDATGNMYVADSYNQRIRKISLDGQVTTFAGSGSSSVADGFGTDASFSNPLGAATDQAGNIYVVEQGSTQVRKITPNGVVSTLAGSRISGFGDGTGAAATFTVVNAAATDAAGNIYVTDSRAIRKITPAGVVTTFAGSSGTGALNGLGKAATFKDVAGLAFDAAGNLYVADRGNYLIRKITPAGLVSTYAGLTGKSGDINGNVSVATFNSPVGVAVDASGNVYVSQLSEIRMITPAGMVSTIAGAFQPGKINGDFGVASFNYPEGLTFDVFGNLYVADRDNAVIRKLGLTGYTITPVLPAGLSLDVTTGAIIGTPTAVTPAINYTVTAYNAKGNSSSTFSITIINSPTKTQTITFPVLNAAVYGSADIAPGATASSGLTTVYTSSNTKVATIVAGKIHVLGQGTTTITALQPGDATYIAATSVARTLAVSPAPLTITAVNKAKYAGNANPLFTAGYSGFVNGDTESVFTVQPVLSCKANEFSAAGSYSIAVSGAVAANYTIKYVMGTLNIKPAPAPAITSVSPATGVAGTNVTITGLYLSQTTSVSFGGVPAKSFNIVSPGSITAIIGTGAHGNILVTTTTGTASFAGFNFMQTPAIYPSGTVSIPNGGSRLLTTDLSSGYSYQWLKDGSGIKGANSSVYTATLGGTYAVQVSLNGLSLVSDATVIGAKTAPFPNPFEDIVNVYVGRDLVKNTAITIYDTNNNTVYSNNYTNQSGILQIYVPGIKSGLYVLKVSADGKETVYKVLRK